MLFPWYAALFALPIFLTWLLAAHRANSKTLMISFLCCLAPFLVQLPVTVLGAVGYQQFSPTFIQGARTRLYAKIARELSKQLPDKTLLSSEVGALGYYYQGRVIDAAGVTGSGALKYHPMSIPDQRAHGLLGAIPVGFVEEASPDIIVSYDIFDQALINSEAASNYKITFHPILLASDLRKLKGKANMWGAKSLHIMYKLDDVSQSVPRK
ncbi:MAG: hypothetical protein D6719_04105 [Candidatus Dadabacteria bacterium]|nr:MAG: hypothetical protein D6719_04105 [Candidatus Dadabacteria bacterium]